MLPAMQDSTGNPISGVPLPQGAPYVTFQKGDQYIGWIGWDGTQYQFDFSRSNNPEFGPELLQEIIHRPVQNQEISSDNPEPWLANLHVMFGNVYLSASRLKKA